MKYFFLSTLFLLSYNSRIFSQTVSDSLSPATDSVPVGIHLSYNPIEGLDGGYGAGFDFYKIRDDQKTIFFSASFSTLNFKDDSFGIDTKSNTVLLTGRIGLVLNKDFTPYLMVNNGSNTTTTKSSYESSTSKSSDTKLGVGAQMKINFGGTELFPAIEYNGYSEEFGFKIGVQIDLELSK